MLFMYAAIAFAALAVYMTFMAIFSEKGRQADVVKARLSSLGEDPRGRFVLDEELNQPLLTRFIRPVMTSIGAALSRLMPKKKNTDALRAQKKSQQDMALRRMLQQAGLPLSVENYKLLRLIIMVACAAAFVVLGAFFKLDASLILLLGVAGPIVAYILVRYVTASLATARKKKLEHELPDILDILSISVEAGLGFEQSIQHMTQNMSGPMIDEFHVAYREMSMGRTRREAMQALAERCDFEDIHTFTGAVIQAGQLGISIKNVLRSQSAAMRLSRKSRAQEKAAKISTKMLLPMVAFVFPVLFIILLGPALVNIISTMG